MLVLYSACTQRACMAGDVMVLLKASRTGALQFLKLECQELLRQILLWLHGLVSAGLRRRGALLPPPPQVPPGGLGTALLHKRVVAGGPWDKLASAKRRQRPATTLPRSVAAARAQRAVPVLGGKRKLLKF